MKNIKQARFVESSFLFLVISLLMLFSPCAGKAQNNSTANLAGTVWNRTPQVIEFPADGTFATIRRGYTFGRQSNVKEALSVIKSDGQALTYDYDYRTDENRLMTRPTMGMNTFEITDGTYEINGKSVYLDFPGYTVTATIYGDSMRGELTFKRTSKKEEWIVRRQSSASNEPIVGGKFSAPADSPMIGTWKYVEHSDNGEVTRTSTFIYSQNGVVESIHQVGTDTIKTRNNWKYTATSPESGVLEEFSGDDLVERGNVKFGLRLTGGRGQRRFVGTIEYTVTFAQDSKLIGHRSIWIKQ